MEKNIRIKMKGGKTRLQRVKVLKSGKYKFIKNKKRKRKTSNLKRSKLGRRTRWKKKHNPNRKGGKKRMGRKNNNIAGQIMKWSRVGALLLPGIGYATMKLSTNEKIRHIGLIYTGWDNREHRFKPEWLIKGWTPYLSTVLVTGLVQKISAILRRF